MPFTNKHLLLEFQHSLDGLQAFSYDAGLIVVRLAPYSLPARFRSWVTTADGASAALSAVESLAHVRGLAASWATPDPSGVSVSVPVLAPPLLTDGAGLALGAEARVTLDGAGVAGAALVLSGPDNPMRRSRVPPGDLGAVIIRPAIEAALGMLTAGEFLARCWCQIDLVGLPAALLLADEGNKSAAAWVPTGGDLALPADDSQVDALARQAAYAYARSAGLPFWDRPRGFGSSALA